MIKIIKQGTRKKVTCDECGTIFSYEDEDVNHVGDNSIDPAWRKNYVICPVCKRSIVLVATR